MGVLDAVLRRQSKKQDSPDNISEGKLNRKAERARRALSQPKYGSNQRLESPTARGGSGSKAGAGGVTCSWAW